MSALIEAANRAEATAILIRANYKVYRPEADVDGEDLVLQNCNSSTKQLMKVQLKSRPTVDDARYREKELWMLFPDPGKEPFQRDWFLILHDDLSEWIRTNSVTTQKWDGFRHRPSISAALRSYLEPSVIKTIPNLSMR